METAALLVQSYPFDFDGEAHLSMAFPAEMLMQRVIDIPTHTYLQLSYKMHRMRIM